MTIPPVLLPWLRRPPGGPDEKPPTWRERLAALRHVPPLLRLVFETHRGYTAAILGLRVVRAFIPLAVLWVGKLIIDSVVASISAQGTLDAERGAPVVIGSHFVVAVAPAVSPPHR